ncbi:hypothetical protein GGH12_002668 [Coemansia sp. RSA 1822]|nr:hypothetical protein LPJ76_002683 [Coemansia sp. RSA 638]KAJ2125196.1 hypothetical protein IW147_001095 [Coemansia sp. RSA 720]KAJ2563248.1 hypothetical protein GGH12_002668 [Coemansia sp. RSA 1822]
MAPKHFAPVWQHYERHEPTGRSKHHRAICKFCSYELSGQPERMKTHLQRCTNCPQHIKDEYGAEDPPSSNGTPYNNNFAISMSAMEFEHAEEDTPVRSGGEPALKRRRSMEVGSGAEGLAGLPWAPTANASAIAPTPAAVPPGFQQVYATPAAAPPVAPPPPTAAPATTHVEPSFSGVYENVRGYYSRLTPMNKMQTSIGPTVSPHPLIRDAIAKVPKPVRDRFYGCGVPLPTGIDGLRVLDLGCGAGRDCYVAAKLVGPAGEVIGVDMTDEQLRVAREFVPEYARQLGYQPHLRFVKGYIEFLSQQPDLYAGSIDLCISNNAVNLSPNKELVLRSVFEILKEGGEFQFSDIYADRRLPNHVRTHPVLMGECLGGALYTEDFKRLCQRVGFMDARQVSAPAAVRIEAPELRDLVGATQFYSITFRLFKFARPASVLEPTREDYGQVAVYRGTIDGQRARVRFDNQWAFEAHRPVLVDGNTAVILGESWLRRHFEVRGDRSQHFGGFTAQPPSVQYEPWETDEYDECDVGPGIEPTIRRRGIQPLATPFFLTGLRQPDTQSRQQVDPQSVSRRASPVYEHRAHGSPQNRTLANPGRGLREHPTTFPRLSSFSISHSNVRAENAGMRAGPLRSTAVSHSVQQTEAGSDHRFVLPVGRVAPPYKGSGSPAALRFSVAPANVHPPQVSASSSNGQSASGVHAQGSSPSIRSGSTASPVATHGSASTSRGSLPIPPNRLHTQPFSSAPPTSTRPHLSPSPPCQHSPHSVATAFT